MTCCIDFSIVRIYKSDCSNNRDMWCSKIVIVSKYHKHSSLHVFISVCTVCLCACMCACAYLCMHVYMSVCMYVSVFVQLRLCVCMSIRVYVHMCVYMSVRVRVCVRTCVCMQRHGDIDVSTLSYHSCNTGTMHTHKNYIHSRWWQ